MKKLLGALVALVGLSTAAIADDVWVNGYFRNDGTYVQPHYRSAPDSNPYNNWSTRGNINPYTGQVGSKDPYSFGNSYSNDYGSSYGGGLSGYGNNSFGSELGTPCSQTLSGC